MRLTVHCSGSDKPDACCSVATSKPAVHVMYLCQLSAVRQPGAVGSSERGATYCRCLTSLLSSPSFPFNSYNERRMPTRSSVSDRPYVYAAPKGFRGVRPVSSQPQTVAVLIRARLMSCWRITGRSALSVCHHLSDISTASYKAPTNHPGFCRQSHERYREA